MIPFFLGTKGYLTNYVTKINTYKIELATNCYFRYST